MNADFPTVPRSTGPWLLALSAKIKLTNAEFQWESFVDLNVKNGKSIFVRVVAFLSC